MLRKLLLVLGALLLILTAACATVEGVKSSFCEEYVLLSQEYTTTGNVMIVFYRISDGLYFFWCDTSAIITDNGDTWDVDSPQVKAKGISKAIATYDYYKYKVIEPVYDDEGNPLPIYIADLNLEPPDADDLPKSEHIGKLIAVNTTATKPATVRRRWMEVNYDTQCLVTESIKEMWIAGNLSIGDYILVSFIEEMPNTTEKNIAIVTDKVYESW
jgi:hypothetical protein